MSEAGSSPESSSTDEPTDVESLEAAIEETREHLAETVDALSAKADVKARASAKADELKARTREAATDDQGRLRPVVPIGGGVAVAVLVALLVLRARRRRR